MSAATLATSAATIVGARAAANIPATLGELLAHDPIWLLRFRDFGPTALKKVVIAARLALSEGTPAAWQPAPLDAPKLRRTILGTHLGLVITFTEPAK